MAKKALNEMSFLDHLEELRWLLVRSTSAVIIMAIVTYFFSDFIFMLSLCLNLCLIEIKRLFEGMKIDSL